jgi:cyanophycinase-like exopeptidase
MALAEVTWTPSGMVVGLGVVRGVVVMPHADADAWARNVRRLAGSVPEQLGVLGLAERTAIVGPAEGPWRVVGAGEVRWLPRGMRDPDAAVVVRHGDALAR